jgi:hypothetical protein
MSPFPNLLELALENLMVMRQEFELVSVLVLKLPFPKLLELALENLMVMHQEFELVSALV